MIQKIAMRSVRVGATLMYSIIRVQRLREQREGRKVSNKRGVSEGRGRNKQEEVLW